MSAIPDCHCGPCPQHGVEDPLLFPKFEIEGHWFILTSVNYQTNEATGKYFKSREEADEWLHEISRKQLPKWHLVHCAHCRNKASE